MREHGKWKQRILDTLVECSPLSMRQLSIRCGAYTVDQYSAVRHTARALLRQRKIAQLADGRYAEEG